MKHLKIVYLKCKTFAAIESKNICGNKLIHFKKKENISTNNAEIYSGRARYILYTIIVKSEIRKASTKIQK